MKITGARRSGKRGKVLRGDLPYRLLVSGLLLLRLLSALLVRGRPVACLEPDHAGIGELLLRLHDALVAPALRSGTAA